MARHVDGYCSYCVNAIIDDAQGFRSEIKNCKSYPEAEKEFKKWLPEIRALTGLKKFVLKLYGGGDLLKYDGANYTDEVY